MAESTTSKALVWDKTGEREFESGVEKVALFVQKTDGTYENGVAWNGVTGITENPGGADKTDLYADDTKYATLRAAETFGCTIEAFTYPDEWNECDGSAMVGSTGAFVGQQTRKPFGLVYITKIGADTNPGMDKGHKLHIVYNLTASPSSRGYSTINDNPDAITFSWEADSTPVPVQGVSVETGEYKHVSTIIVDSTKADPAKLAALEAKLYGGTEDPTLLNPGAVLIALGASPAA